MEKDIAQFKLSSGNEIVCEVVEWPDNDGDDIIVKNIMTIIPYELEGSIVYGFKPWLHYFESDDEYATLNTNHIVASARPNKHLRYNYNESVGDMNENSYHRDQMTNFSNKTRRQKVEEIINKIKEGYFEDGSDDDKGTLH